MSKILPPNYKLQTIDGLFEFIWPVDPDSVAEYKVDYDEKLGYPKYIYINFDSTLGDEEISFTTEFINKIDF